MYMYVLLHRSHSAGNYMYMQENCTGLSEKMTTVQCMVSLSVNYNTQFLFKTSDLQVTNVIMIFWDILDV